MPQLKGALIALLGLVGSAATAPSGCTSNSVKLQWVGDTPDYTTGTTFGVPWPQGKFKPNDTSFSISGGMDMESWVTGYWRDGSVKWSAHAIPPIEDVQDEYTIKASRGSTLKTGSISVDDSDSEVTVDTGKITVTFPKEGNSLISSIQTASGKTVGRNGKLILHSQSTIADDAASRTETSIDYFNFESNIEKVEVSKDSSVRALVTVRGKYQLQSEGEHDDWLPFVLRFYLYSESDSIRVIHSVVFDGEADKDFVSGLGIRLQVPLAEEELYNRHVRLGGAVKGITGLRRDPGEEVRSAQFEGKETPNIDTWDTRVSSRMQWIPEWNDYSLRQLTADGFNLKKRTKPGQSWIDISAGTRSSGLAYLGGATVGGLAVGLRDFYKQYPSGLDISKAASDNGEITLWLHSPDAEPLDLRPYHDGMGLDTYEEQLDALEITYEDYEPGFDTPYGIAKTSEIYIHAFDATPSAERLGQLSKHLQAPPVLYADPKHIHATKGFGSYWDLVDRSTPRAATIEDNMAFLNEFYQGQVDERSWFGFLNYGDVMHTYDNDRHTWRYDIGGYAWDNSELSPDLFFWQYFLHTGDAKVYRFAEAMTRHTGEVDCYHIGDWKGLGTRHGVLHFSDSAKQGRIAQPQYRKYFYYLTGGDERVGELLTETLDADKTYGKLDPVRKVREDGWVPEPGKPFTFGLGTDWGAMAAGWLIEWERRGPRWEEAREKLTNTAAGIANLTNGFVTGSATYDIDARTLTAPPADPNNEGIVEVSHLSAVFGAPEVISEALEYWGDDAPEGFKDAWLDYCYYYSAPASEQEERYGEAFGKLNLYQAHMRLTAYYAQQKDDKDVAVRAWKEFYESTDGFLADQEWAMEEISGPEVLLPIHEAAWISTNAAAQYGLAGIQGLALARDALEEYSPPS
ncbi:uncharacterized protein F5Z01DRAFT_741921 [Emericellopsis atlantica]|uniref:Tat pathway signal sequence domain protein n=1 Tax=Emericellopsis atlantica TaxID=2614577 RepID=A0A9P7ZQM9_9HYPO|nr:uncharacterized protein F5Z01DRAFT_741921 [Emericellopsis atlantica]KAG9256549.1 hypothetical protein F5Z01DRAFT_741921 [Emericellopsis atlantica]